MAQLHFYLPDDEEKILRRRAREAGMPLSRYLATLVRDRVREPEQWPEDYFEEVFGKWEGEPLQRAPQGEYERRGELD